MSEKNSGLSEAGPPPRTSVDWSFTPRPGRYLDAAEVRLARAQHEQLKLGALDFLAYTLEQFVQRCGALRRKLMILGRRHD
ncbi:MAG: hypothetical protein AB7T48_08190 [Solirubrobacterales bacterium]